MIKEKVKRIFYLHTNDDLLLGVENVLYKGKRCCYSKTTCMTAVVFIQSYFVVSLTEHDGCLRLCCCYRTVDWTDEAVGHTDVVFYIAYSWAACRGCKTFQNRIG
jgi:hypothetical protein